MRGSITRLGAVLMALLLAITLGPLGPLRAQAAGFRLAVDPALLEDGFARFVTVRFGLKTGTQVTLAPLGAGPADAVLAPLEGAAKGGDPVLVDPAGRTIALRLITPATEAAGAQAAAFAAWLASPVGQSTIAQFTRPDGGTYRPAAAALPEAAAALPEGDVQRGEEVSYRACGRCHVIGPENRMKGIETAPSFGALRALPDWQERFETFFVRIPHPATVQLKGVSSPFSPARPPAIWPVEITQEEFEDLLAFVARMKPADLGAPIQSR